MDDLIREFLTETNESLSVLDVELVKFERDPTDAAILGNIFRLVHTIKGTCGFLGLARLEAVAHAGENILGKFRDGALPVTPAAVTLILKCLDRVRYILGELEANGAEPTGEDGELIAELNRAAEGEAPAAAPEPESAPDQADAFAPIADESGFPVAAELLAEVERALEAEDSKQSSTPVPAVPAARDAEPVKQAAREAAGEASVAHASIRVNVDVLENLMTLISELVLTRNQLLQMVRGHDDSAFKAPLQRLSHITTDLQEGVMKTRMQPIGNGWAKLPRIVRDLSVDSGKKIELEMIGADTELDRQVLELIKDPLTHMVRNSVDHGLETPADRRKAGKPETGTITLKAYHEGGHIVIVIADDGRGLDVAKIRAKALANGLGTAAEIDGMTDQQAMQFVFRAGFSTADKITNVSGRGVGMDVVRTNIEKIGGVIELASKSGQGTTFTIKIPLTLAIVSALIVAAAEQRFAVPQINVLELVRASKDSGTRIEIMNASPVLRLREKLLPLVSLRRLLKLDATEQTSLTDGDQFIVVAQVGAHVFGIIVDKVFDTEEIVVKPVSPILRSIPFYSGNTILGDGSVVMILDPNGIAQSVGQAKAEETAHDERTAERQERTTFLLFRSGMNEIKAVPLSLVARLEQVAAESVEHAYGHHVVQYRGKLMPLIPFDPSHVWAEKGRQPVLVFADADRSIGLVVDEIVDIVEDRLDIELVSDTPGLLGTAVIAGKATDVIDVGHFLARAFADWFGAEHSAASARKGEVLLVDDSAFFRNLLGPALAAAGWSVTAVGGAVEALRLRDEGRSFDAIVSDIEMPEVNGLAFAGKVRSDPQWKATPLVAVSTKATEADVARGLEAGFDAFVSKAERDTLMATLGALITGDDGGAGPKSKRGATRRAA